MGFTVLLWVCLKYDVLWLSKCCGLLVRPHLLSGLYNLSGDPANALPLTLEISQSTHGGLLFDFPASRLDFLGLEPVGPGIEKHIFRVLPHWGQCRKGCADRDDRCEAVREVGDMLIFSRRLKALPPLLSIWPSEPILCHHTNG